ncbi:MAG: hypothetical protein Q8O13_00735 [Candidatus Omnitrophota bacterium]|nr:hypothetical protein [Candidatus Omnitrophota bacterium]
MSRLIIPRPSHKEIIEVAITNSKTFGGLAEILRIKLIKTATSVIMPIAISIKPKIKIPFNGFIRLKYWLAIILSQFRDIEN